METILCAVCGTPRQRPKACLKKLKRVPTCSRHCNGILNGQAWAKHGVKGRAAWRPESTLAFPAKIQGQNNGRWIGGRRVRSDGYIEVLKPDHPRAKLTGYVQEHMLVMEEKLGHRDHDRANNSPENLQLFASNGAHRHLAHGAKSVAER